MADPTESFDGYRIAEQRIALEAERQSGVLDLSELGLTVFPAGLFRLRHLRRLHLGRRLREVDGLWEEEDFDDTAPENALGDVLAELAALPDLHALSIRRMRCGDLSGVAGLRRLEWLDCSRTQVADLAPIAGCTALQLLDCSTTQVADLAPIAGCTALQSLDCSGTQVADLAPIAGCTALQSLDCSGTQVADLAPIAGCTALQSLDCSFTQVADLAPIAACTALQSLDCSFTQVADLAPIAACTALLSLDCRDTQVADLAPIAGCTALLSLDCRDTQVADLAPIAGCTALQSLDCWSTQVADLAPIAGCTALQSLDCGFTQVADLAPIAGCTALQSLDCSVTQVADLAPIAGCTALQSLDCWNTQVADLAPIAGCTALQSLDCRVTQVADLAPIAGCTALLSLDCSFTQVADLAPIAGCTALQSLDCRKTQVADLAPIAGCTALQSLDCSFTQVADLAPIAGCTALQTLNCSSCVLQNVPDAVWHLPVLLELFLYQAQVPGIDPAVLSQTPGDDCLQAVRADLADWRAEAAELTDVKLLVLGNGRSGKTQLTRRLRGEVFQAEWNSTHGVLITSASLPAPDGGPETPLSIWDFGGQDIYHGTHALFVRSRAVFMLVWSDGTERDRRPEYAHQGITFRNHPLAYWVDYARHLAHAESPTLIVQTKCDQDAERRADVPEQALKALGFVLEKHASAVLPDGLDELKAALRQAIRVLRDRQGIIRVGAGRLRVKQKIEALRNPDGTWPEEHRLLKRATFDAWCIEEGGKVSSPDALLTWLHNSGAVFHPRELLQDQIVLDHTWALNAIYAVFDRTSCYPRLLRDGGIFDRARLEELVWGKGARPQDPAWTGYTVDDQRLFLTIMRSCGICFVYRKGQRGYEDDGDTEYVAPDLLPVRDAMQLRIEALWGAGPASAGATFTYPLLHPGVMRGVMGRIGDRAGIHALYWRGGLLVYEATTRSHAMIEAVVVKDGWAGTVTVQTRHGESAALLDLLAGWVAEENSRLGLQPEVTFDPDPARGARTAGRGPRRTAGVPDAVRAGRRTRRAKRPPRDDDPAEAPMEPKFTAAPPAFGQYAISYAWNDKTGGPEREDVVNRLEAAANKQDIQVLRDKSVLKPGDRISVFTHEIARSERVFVFLSAKYLESYPCMAELYEVWRRCEDEAAFRQRVRVYQLPDGGISDFVRRQDVRKWWAAKHQAMKDAAGGADDVSTADQDELRRTGHIARHASDILSLIKDTIGIRNIDDLIRVEFPNEPPPPVA